MIEKPELDESELQKNYEEFIKFVEEFFTGERQEKLLFMYSSEEMGMPAVMAPASSIEHFHLAHPGGYLQHIMHVVKASYGVKKLWKTMKCNIDFTDEEMVFAALHHDLGKLGDKEQGEYYVFQTEDWKKRRGEIYDINPNLQHMEVTDRAVFTLQKYGVPMNWREYLGIKLADGMYNEAAKEYLKTGNKARFLKTNLPRVIHLADYTSCRAEYDSWAYPPKVEMPL
jgi:hypothetical protein